MIINSELTKFDIIIDKIKQVIDQKKYLHTKIAICFIGGPGSGKTTIANILGNKYNLYVHGNDYIRRLLEENKLNSLDFDENQQAVRYIAIEIHKYLCENGIGFIMDANIMNSVDFVKEQMDNYNYKFILIKVDCNEKIAIERITKRLEENNSNEYSHAKLVDYQRYIDNLKNLDIQSELISYTIDTSNTNIESEIKDIDSLICTQTIGR